MEPDLNRGNTTSDPKPRMRGPKGYARSALSRREFLHAPAGVVGAFCFSEGRTSRFTHTKAATSQVAAAGSVAYGNKLIFDVGGPTPAPAVAVGSSGSPGHFSETATGRLEEIFQRVFLESDTDLVAFATVPANWASEPGPRLAGWHRSLGWFSARAKNRINAATGSERAYCHGFCDPSWFWNRQQQSIDRTALADYMEREAESHGIDAWTLVWGEGQQGPAGRRLSKTAAYFFEIARGLETRLVTIQLESPEYSFRDLEEAVLENPDFNFIIGRAGAGPHNAGTLHRALIDIKRRRPGISNLYIALGRDFDAAAEPHAAITEHRVGEAARHYGIDHLVWGAGSNSFGSPHRAIAAFQRFQIRRGLREAYGYPPLTNSDKADIFARNALRLYRSDPARLAHDFREDSLARARHAYRASRPPAQA